ncbi:MAG: hypothetical protein HQL32_00565 [Planctomycetes bacterium]|nr:hypothetical protein [Planctomycetota bacterium]
MSILTRHFIPLFIAFVALTSGLLPKNMVLCQKEGEEVHLELEVENSCACAHHDLCETQEKSNDKQKASRDHDHNCQDLILPNLCQNRQLRPQLLSIELTSPPPCKSHFLKQFRYTPHQEHYFIEDSPPPLSDHLKIISSIQLII